MKTFFSLLLIITALGFASCNNGCGGCGDSYDIGEYQQTDSTFLYVILNKGTYYYASYAARLANAYQVGPYDWSSSPKPPVGLSGAQHLATYNYPIDSFPNTLQYALRP